jgi:peptidyl-prolyl cis-trans isomerase C
MKTSIFTALFASCLFSSSIYAQLLPQGLSAPPSSSAGPVPQADIRPDTVVATVAGVGVTVADVRKILQTAPQTLAQLFQQNPQQALGQVFQMRYLASEGEKAKLDQEEPLKGEIEQLIILLKQQVLANAMVNQEYNRYEVTGEQIDEFYGKNQSRWEEAKIKIILLGFKPAPLPGAKPDQVEDAAKNALAGAHPINERTEQEAQKLAENLVKQLRTGADFAKLVTQYSDDAESKNSGGDFGTPIKATSSFAQDLKKAVFAMKPGDISDPIRQGNGLYIIRLEEIKVQPINDVRESIVKELRDTHLNSYLKDLTARFTPQVVRPEFFVKPGLYLSPPAPAPAPAQPQTK